MKQQYCYQPRIKSGLVISRRGRRHDACDIFWGHHTTQLWRMARSKL